jgi:NAD(P)H-dependent FMN reductase
MTRLLAISGSLRAGSSNTMLLDAAARLTPDGVEIAVYRHLDELPAFNPDLDTESAPQAVLRFRSELQKSQGVIISTPEYAHGVPGALKNALDWLVASGEMYEKPVALFNASARGTFAQASLLETLTVMTAKIISAASVTIELTGKGLDSTGIIADPTISETIRSAVSAFAQAINAG